MRRTRNDVDVAIWGERVVADVQVLSGDDLGRRDCSVTDPKRIQQGSTGALLEVFRSGLTTMGEAEDVIANERRQTYRRVRRFQFP